MTDTAAREYWEQRIHERSDAIEDRTALPAPTGLRATPAAGHIRLSWDPVAGAAGYLIERTGRDGEPEVLRHGGADVPAVPGTAFACTGAQDGVDYAFRVAAIASPEAAVMSWSDAVAGSTLAGDPGPVTVRVDASVSTGRLDRVWRMVGSERLSQLTLGADEHGNDIGAEFAEALRLAHDDLGVTSVRAHAIFHDDLKVVRRAGDGSLSFDFSAVDAIYDHLLRLGIRPIVELSFMPAALARDPDQTVFTYRAIVSPPRDWAEWHELIHRFTSHLVQRYGLAEVASWAFEVWNEPNLGVFWTGSQAEYFRLYDEAARAIKSVDQSLRVGGPSTAACEWVEALAAHARAGDLPLDFVSTHTYGNQPLDLRPALARQGFGEVPIWWTEWGAGSTHFGPIHDSVMGAPFILDGYAAAAGRLGALAYWVISDHFEELGRPPRLFHDGFGLLTVGNLRKPRYWAVHLAAHQGDSLLATVVSGDGADVLVQATGTSHDDGSYDLLVWNGTINSAVMDGDPRLNREIQVDLVGLPGGCYEVLLARVDRSHSNIAAHLPAGVEWPDPVTWAHLRSRDVLDEVRLADLDLADGTGSVNFNLPMPGVARLRLRAR